MLDPQFQGELFTAFIRGKNSHFAYFLLIIGRSDIKKRAGFVKKPALCFEF